MTSTDPTNTIERLVCDENAAGLLRINNRIVLETTATLDSEPRTLEEQQRWLAQRSGGRSRAPFGESEVAAEDVSRKNNLSLVLQLATFTD